MPERRGTRLGVRSGRTIRWNPVDERPVSSGYGYITKSRTPNSPNRPQVSEPFDVEDGNLPESFSADWPRRWQRHNAGDDVNRHGIEFSLNKCRRWELPGILKERIHECQLSSGSAGSTTRIELVERHDLDRVMANKTDRQYVTAVYDTHSNSSGSGSHRAAQNRYSNYRELRQQPEEEASLLTARYVVSYSPPRGRYPAFSEKGRRSFKYSTRQIGRHPGRQRRRLDEMEVLKWETMGMTASECIRCMSDWQQEEEVEYEVIEQDGNCAIAEDESEDENITFSEYQRLTAVKAKSSKGTAIQNGRVGLVNPAMSNQVLMHGKGTFITLIPDSAAESDTESHVPEPQNMDHDRHPIGSDSLRQFGHPETVGLNICTESVDDALGGRYKGHGYIITSDSWPRRISSVLPLSNEAHTTAVVLTISSCSSPVVPANVAIHSDIASLREQLYRKLEVLAHECVTLTIPRILGDLFDICNQHAVECDNQRPKTNVDHSEVSISKRKSLHSADFMCKAAGSDLQLVSPSSALKNAAILLYANGQQTKTTHCTMNCSFPLECPVCWEDFHETSSTWYNVTSLSNCSHTICNTCLMLHIASCTQEGFVVVACPVYQCSHAIDLSTMLSLMPPALFPRYNERLHHSVLQNSPNWQWCPSEKCSMAVYSPIPDSVAGVSCSCGQVWCFKCGEKVHWPASCHQAESFRQEVHKRGDDVNDLDWLVIVHVKKCPRCHQPMEKNGGCQHMSCRCGHHFCWECLGDWSAHGTTLTCPQGKRNLLDIELNGGDVVGPGTKLYKDALLHLRQTNSSAMLKRQRKFEECMKTVLATALRRQRRTHHGVEQNLPDFIGTIPNSMTADCSDEELNDSGVSDLSQSREAEDCSESQSPAIIDVQRRSGLAPELLAVLADQPETTDIVWSAAQFCQEAHTVLAFVAVTQYNCVKKRRNRKIAFFVDKLEFILKSLEATIDQCQTARNGTLVGNVKKLETFVDSGMTCLRHVSNSILWQK